MKNHPGNAPAYSMEAVEALAGHPLAGKQVLFLGSSVTWGSASEQQGIPEYFAARFGCSCTKEAVSGTTLADNGPDSYVQRLIRTADSSPHFDLMVCQLSTNDASRGIPLGRIAQGRELQEFDTATVTGAMEYIIRYTLDTWGCPTAFYTGSRYDSLAYEAMVEQVYRLKEKWGIRVLDLWTEDRFNSLTCQQRQLYMADPIHPTRAGYRLWWCPELERQIRAWF